MWVFGWLNGHFHFLVSSYKMAGMKHRSTNPHHTNAVLQATCQACCMSMCSMFMAKETQLNRSKAAPEVASSSIPVMQ